jgi:hypothetical protein
MMTGKHCVCCNCDIHDGNDSVEHVIPNSVGGRLKVRGFICTDCNSRTGQTWDAVFAEQHNFFSNFFGVVRERGLPPQQAIETSAGERLLMQPDGSLRMQKPVYRETPTATGKQIQITARDRREATNILEGVARKYPSQIDVAVELAKSEERYNYPEGVVYHSPQFGGAAGGRSLVKTATAFAFHCGVSVGQCDLAVEYLRDKTAEPSFGYYYESDLVAGRPAGVPIHCVAVAGDPTTGMLLGYVEYFGVNRVVVCLSQSYAGPPLARSYGLDPTTGNTVPLQVDLPFSAADVRAIYDYEKTPDGGMQRAYDEIMPTALKRNFDRELASVIKRAAQYALENCGAKPGDELTAEQTAKLGPLVMKYMMPFLQRHARRQ